MKKSQYERKNPIDWKNYKCGMCKLLLKIDPIGYDVLNSEMSYGDLRYEHKFVRNIYLNVEIIQSPQICTLKNYYEDYQKFIKICTALLALLDFHDSDDVKLTTILKIF